MSAHAHRVRHRRQQVAAAPPSDPRQDQVDDWAAELLVLWRAMPNALAADSAGQLNGDRHASGGSKGSPAPANATVIDAAVIIETGLMDIEAQAVPLLRLDRRPRRPLEVIEALPDWYRNLGNAGQPLAGHIYRDLRSWVREAQGAIGTRRMDRRLGPNCPDHRDTRPAPLLEVGAQARLAASLLAGPPAVVRVLAGPTCGRGLYVDCAHESCEAIRHRRLVDERGRLTDWVQSPSDGVVWLAADGAPAFTWQEARTIRCPVCKTQWTTTTERRVLARRLAELGDARPDAAALVT